MSLVSEDWASSRVTLVGVDEPPPERAGSGEPCWLPVGSAGCDRDSWLVSANVSACCVDEPEGAESTEVWFPSLAGSCDGEVSDSEIELEAVEGVLLSSLAIAGVDVSEDADERDASVVVVAGDSVESALVFAVSSLPEGLSAAGWLADSVVGEGDSVASDCAAVPGVVPVRSGPAVMSGCPEVVSGVSAEVVGSLACCDSEVAVPDVVVPAVPDGPDAEDASLSAWPPLLVSADGACSLEAALLVC